MTLFSTSDDDLKEMKRIRNFIIGKGSGQIPELKTYSTVLLLVPTEVSKTLEFILNVKCLFSCKSL
jgi:hypothetical protein